MSKTARLICLSLIISVAWDAKKAISLFPVIPFRAHSRITAQKTMVQGAWLKAQGKNISMAIIPSFALCLAPEAMCPLHAIQTTFCFLCIHSNRFGQD
jgi:hypothetical protein